jgi:hypothetical protein
MIATSAPTRTLRALAAAPGVCDALTDGAEGEVALVLSRGAYLRLGSEWLMLVDQEEPFGPLSLIVERLGRLSLAPGWPAWVVGDRLLLGPSEVSVARMRRRPTARVTAAEPGSRAAISRAAAATRLALPAPPAPLGAGLAALAAGRARAAAATLAGLGDGLTPAGDDVLTGYAAARTAGHRSGALRRERPGEHAALSSLVAGRASPIGLAYLRRAERGELPDVAARLLVAITRGAVADVAAALPALRSWGASSGIAMGWGITAAFDL